MDDLLKELCAHIESTRQRLDSVSERLEKSATLVQAVSDAESKLDKTGEALRETIENLGAASKDLAGFAQSTNQIYEGFRRIAEDISDSGFKQVKNDLPEISGLCIKIDDALQKSSASHETAILEAKKSVSDLQSAIDMYHQTTSETLSQITERCQTIENESCKSAKEILGAAKGIDRAISKMSSAMDSLHRAEDAKTSAKDILSSIQGVVKEIKTLADAIRSFHQADVTELDKIRQDISQILEMRASIPTEIKSARSSLSAELLEAKDVIIGSMKAIDENREMSATNIDQMASERIAAYVRDTKALIDQTRNEILREATRNRKYFVTGIITILLLFVSAGGLFAYFEVLF